MANVPFLVSANWCAVKVKSLWPQSRPIRQADTSQATTPTTQTIQSMPTRRRSWSTICWRSLLCPWCLTSSTWRSATAPHLSDPSHRESFHCTALVSLPQLCHFRDNGSTYSWAQSTINNLISQQRKMKVVWWVCASLLGQPEDCYRVYTVKGLRTRLLPKAKSTYFLYCRKLLLEFLDYSISKCFLFSFLFYWHNNLLVLSTQSELCVTFVQNLLYLYNIQYFIKIVLLNVQ